MKYERQYYVYILTNTWNTTLYIGVTNNLIRRVRKHRVGLNDGFTKKYRLKKLVYYEVSHNIIDAIEREKQLKRWHRAWKFNLIRSMNPDMKDLMDEIE